MIQSRGSVTNLLETTTQINLDSEIKRKNDAKKDAQIFIPENYSIHEPPPTADGKHKHKMRLEFDTESVIEYKIVSW